MAIVSLFWICGSVVMPYVYNLSRYCRASFLSLSVRLVTVCWVEFPCLLKWGFFMGYICMDCSADMYFVFF